MSLLLLQVNSSGGEIVYQVDSGAQESENSEHQSYEEYQKSLAKYEQDLKVYIIFKQVVQFTVEKIYWCMEALLCQKLSP